MESKLEKKVDNQPLFMKLFDLKSDASREEVAKIIADGILARKRTLIMTGQGKLAVWVNKLFPAFADKKVFELFAKEKNPLIK